MLNKTYRNLIYILIGLVVFFLIAGYVADPQGWLASTFLNLGTEILSILITVAVINEMLDSREEAVREKEKLVFSNGIIKVKREPTEGNRTGYLHRINFENIGTQNIFDVEIRAILKIRHPNTPNRWLDYNISTSRSGRESYRIARIKPAIPNKRGNRLLISLYPNCSYDLTSSLALPDGIKLKVKQEAVLLEDIMSLDKDSTLQVLATGYESVTGRRKMFESPEYTLNDIKNGDFAPYSVDIIEAKVPETS